MLYQRKVSRSEAENNRLMILKSELGKFPPVGSGVICSFEENGRQTGGMMVEEACTCMGAAKPHFHWYLVFDEPVCLVPGSTVRVNVSRA